MVKAAVDRIASQRLAPSAPASRPTPAADSGNLLNERLVMALIGAFVLIIGFARPLRDGFFIDELLIMWVTEDSLGEAISRGYTRLSHTPAYFGLVWIWRQLVGNSEFLIRLPALVAFAASAFHLHRICMRFSERTADIAVLVFVTLPFTFNIAHLAKPYSLMLLCLVYAVRRLLDWVDSGGAVGGLAAVLALSAAIHLVWFAGLTLPVFLLAARHVWRSHPDRRKHVVIVLSVGLIAVAMLVPHILEVQSRSDLLVTSRRPLPNALASAVAPPLLVFALLAGSLANRRSLNLRELTRRLDVRLLGLLALVPIVLLFVLSTLLPTPLWTDRYLRPAVPWTAAMFALVVARFDYRGRVVALASLLLVVPMLLPLSRTVQDWPGNLAWADERVGEGVLLFVTPVPESRPLEALDDPFWAGYLNSPVSTYPVNAETRLAPRDGEALSDLIEELVPLGQPIGWVAPSYYSETGPRYIDARMRALGWTKEKRPPTSYLDAIVYSPPVPAGDG